MVPKLLDLHYKIDDDTDYVVSFRGNRQKKLGDDMAN